MFIDIGKSLLVSLLDYDGLNHCTRVLKTPGVDTLQSAIEAIKQDMKKADEKPTISAFKKKMGFGKKKKFSRKVDEVCLVLTKEESKHID